MQSFAAHPYVDWSQFKVERSETVEPDIYLSHPQDDDASFEIFRRLSHKVAGCRYDIPWGDQIIIAYCKSTNLAESPQAVGVITFSIADKKMTNSRLEEHFMSSYFHTVSFLFVDQRFQRKGVGSRLLSQVMRIFKDSGIQHPVHLEGAKSAVKFFQKLGFTVSGNAGKPLRRGCNLFKECFNMHHHLHT